MDTPQLLSKRSQSVITPALSKYGSTEVEKGSGVYLFDGVAKQYLGFASGIGVVNTGHCHPWVTEKK